MDNRKALNFLKYINTPMSKESITVLYNANNIKYEKCELYNEFIQSLIFLVYDTYMGDDITNENDQKNHFNWCWGKNIENFDKEGFIFNSLKLKNYFLEFMLEVYYPITQKNENQIALDNIIKLWVYIFDYNNNKSKSDMDTLIEVYKMFENSIKIK
jgi:hypothetical protein